MPNNRLYPTVAIGLLFPLAVLAQNPGGAPANPAGAGQVQGGVPIPGIAQATPKEEPPTPAEEALDVAIARVKKIGSFSTDIVQSVDMLNQKFQIKGSFLRAPSYKIYLKLTVEGLSDTKATTLQVCDGTTLWDYREVLDTRSYRKLTLPTILKKLNDPILIGSQAYEMIVSSIGLGGPEAMLVGLRKSVHFDQKDEGVFDGKKVWVIRGQWKDRSGLVAPGQPAPPPTVNLPSYIPSNVAIWFGKDDGFPVKIEMIGRATSILTEDTRKIGADGRRIGAKLPPPKVEPSRIVLQYNNLKLNPTLEAKLFAFDAPAGTANVVDQTEQLISLLDQAIQSETMRKKAEAAKNDPVLNNAIQVPKAGDAPAPAGLPAPVLPTPPSPPQAGPDTPPSAKK